MIPFIKVTSSEGELKVFRKNGWIRSVKADAPDSYLYFIKQFDFVEYRDRHNIPTDEPIPDEIDILRLDYMNYDGTKEYHAEGY